MWFTGEHKEVLAGSVDFSAFGGRLGVNLKPDWNGNVTGTRGGDRYGASCDRVASDCKVCHGLRFIYWTYFLYTRFE